MAYVRREVKDLETVFNKSLYDNVQDGIDEAKQSIVDTEAKVETVEDVADEALLIAKGKNRAKVFNTTEDMNAWLSVEANKEVMLVGDNLYIVDTEVPDWWVTEVLTTPDAETGFYYKIAELETQRVSLVDIINDIEGLQRTMSDHSSQHATGGSDPITPAEIGAVPVDQFHVLNFTNRGLNSTNIDTEYNYNYIVALSEDGHGTRPTVSSWINVVNFYSTHFVTQLAFSVSSGTVAERGVRIWFRERYVASGVWSNWKIVPTISMGTTPMTHNVTPLGDGEIYFEYKE